VDFEADTGVSEKYIVSIFMADADTIFSERWHVHTSPHGITTQNNNIDSKECQIRKIASARM
jgi:glutamate synthase domain-containing protein 2